jgi:serine/threonine protein kinase
LAKAIGNETILSQAHQSMNTLSGGRTISGGGRVADTLDGGVTMPGSGVQSKSSDASGILGTYDYMAPEQRGEFGGVIDPRTDIYAFGVMLYRMLAGRRPVGRFEDASKLAAISPEWDRLVDHCLAPVPANRYASTELLTQDLRRLELPARQERQRQEENRERQEEGRRRCTRRSRPGRRRGSQR